MKEKQGDVIYVEFQKAFDKVPHQRLLNKLLTDDISVNIHNWIHDSGMKTEKGFKWYFVWLV